VGAIRRDRWQDVIRLHLDGKRVAEIATELGVSHQAISSTLREPEVVEFIEEARAKGIADVVAKLAASADEAADVVIGVMRDGSGEGAALRLRAAVALLDRVGIVGGSRVEVDAATDAAAGSAVAPEELRGLTDEQLEELMRRVENAPRD
jgi:predicted transcriptional regulator